MGCRGDAGDSPIVFAAASTNDALTAIGASFQRQHSRRIRLTLAASSTLAKQIALGAPASLFLSADPRWVDYLSDRGLVEARTPLLQTHLTLVTLRDRPLTVEMSRDFDLAAKLADERLAIGEPEHVPLGIYTREALQRLGWWQDLERKVVPAQDARAALALVERGACRAGVVYDVDARASRRVTIAARFPADSHRPIRYELALLRRAASSGRRVYQFLRGAQAREMFTRWGFLPATVH